MESVKVLVPSPEMLIVALPGLTRKTFKGDGPNAMFDVFPVSVTVTDASVNVDAPSVPVAVVVRVYVIGSAEARPPRMPIAAKTTTNVA